MIKTCSFSFFFDLEFKIYTLPLFFGRTVPFLDEKENIEDDKGT
jgi:hypothetical protein